MTITNLGQITGELLNCFGALESFYEDPITVAYGMGSEMGPLVWSGNIKKAADRLREHGVTAREVATELSARLDPKWLYDSGVDHVLQNIMDLEEVR